MYVQDYRPSWALQVFVKVVWVNVGCRGGCGVWGRLCVLYWDVGRVGVVRFRVRQCVGGIGECKGVSRCGGTPLNPCLCGADISSFHVGELLC